MFADILEASDQYKFILVVTQETLQLKKQIDTLDVLSDVLEDIEEIQDKIALVVTKVDFSENAKSVKKMVESYCDKKNLSDNSKKMFGFLTRSIYLIHTPIAPG